VQSETGRVMLDPSARKQGAGSLQRRRGQILAARTSRVARTIAALSFGTKALANNRVAQCAAGIAFPATIIISASPTTNGPSLASLQDRLSHSTRAIRVSLTSLHTVHVPRRRSCDRIEWKRSCSLPPSARRCRTARAKCSSIAHTPIPDSLLDWLLYHRHDAGLSLISVYLKAYEHCKSHVAV
jgi:hypothetical protein